MFEKIRNLFNKKEENSSGRKVPNEVNDPDSIYYVDPEGYSASVTWVFGALLFVGLVNLVCCTPAYLMAISYLWAKAMGE